MTKSKGLDVIEQRFKFSSFYFNLSDLFIDSLLLPIIQIMK